MRLTHDRLGSIPVRGEETTGDLLMAAARALRRRFATALEAYDVTPGQSRALHVITEHGASRPSEIADALRIAPRSATEVIDALEGRGLVRREPDPDDRRARRIVATAEGERLSAILVAARRQESERQLGALPAADRAELDRILRVLLTDR
jgi:DNA-binding MarR family transcriptional regulator